MLQFLSAEPVADDVWTLSGLLRGQAGSDPAMAALTPAGAAVVVLDEALVRADLALAERGLPLTWRAAPAGGPASGPSMSQAVETWRGLSARPWSPAHLRVRTQGGDAVVTWIRRARLAGDGWDAEVPLGEEREVYRVEILDGETVIRTAETATPASPTPPPSAPPISPLDRPGPWLSGSPRVRPCSAGARVTGLAVILMQHNACAARRTA
jgi:hypothetical protein